MEKIKEHWSKVKLSQLDTRGQILPSNTDFKEEVRKKSPLKVYRLTFEKADSSILDEFIEEHGKGALSKFIIKALRYGKNRESGTTLQ